MHFLDKVPEFAACNEAVELAKQISVQDSKLVNGILRSYTKNPDDMDVKENNGSYAETNSKRKKSLAELEEEAEC